MGLMYPIRKHGVAIIRNVCVKKSTHMYLNLAKVYLSCILVYLKVYLILHIDWFSIIYKTYIWTTLLTLVDSKKQILKSRNSKIEYIFLRKIAI